MLELLPETEKRRLAEEYKLRVLVTVMMLGVSILFVAIVVLFPALIALSIEEESLLAKKELLEGERGENQEAVTKIGENILLADEYLRTNRGAVLDRVLVLFDEVSLTGFSLRTIYPETGKEVVEVSVSGVAPDREALVALQDRFVKSGDFTEVNLPLSVFAEESNIEFSIEAVWQPPL